MKGLDELIRERPLDYLPEVSLSLYWRFISGYSLRCRMEGRLIEERLGCPGFHRGLFREFDDWVKEKFGLPPLSVGPITVVLSFTSNESEAFYRFDLCDEFAKKVENVRVQDPMEEHQWREVKTLDLIGVLKAIRERPPMYLGDTSFRNCHAYLLGDERAFIDLQIPRGEDRFFFDAFRLWIERKKDRSLPRPWQKVISYYGSSGDCGHTKSGAFSLFYKWLDEFAAESGNPDLLRVPIEWWQRETKPQP